MVPSDNVIFEVPEVAVTLPPQVDVISGGAAILKPDGKLSTTATPFRAWIEFGLLRVRVNVVELLIPITGLLKVFWITGGATTWIEAAALLPVPPFADVTGSVVFVKAPAATPRTSTDVVHEVPGMRVISDRLITEEPASADIEPLHVVDKLLGFAICSPGGRGSFIEIPVKATTLEDGFVKVRFSVTSPYRGMVGTSPKDLVTNGGETVT